MEIRHASAGAPQPLLLRKDHFILEGLRSAGVYVGSGYRHIPIKPREHSASIGEGDLLFILSDGISEAHGEPGGSVFSYDIDLWHRFKVKHGRVVRDWPENGDWPRGIADAIFNARERSVDAIADAILKAVRRHSGRTRPEDDQSLIVVQISRPK